jgi:hypothetical protein
MTTRPPSQRRWRLIMPPLIALVLAFLAVTDNAAIWPLRNTLAYQLTRWWETHVGATQSAGMAELRGCVRGAADEPLPGATVLLSERDGTIHLATMDASGCYQLSAAHAWANRMIRKTGRAHRADDGRRMIRRAKRCS